MASRPLIPVHYPGGLYLPELDLWLDPHQAKDRAFISHAHSDHYAEHRQAFCSSESKLLIQTRYHAAAEMSIETHAWETPWEERGYQLKLLPAGHILGSAMLHVTRISDGATLLYTGDFKLRASGTVQTAKLEQADTLILETTFGLPEFRFPPSSQVISQIISFVRETLEDGGIPVLAAYSLGKGQEILSALQNKGIPVMLHSSMLEMTAIYQQLSHTFPPYSAFHAPEAAGHVLIVPPSAVRSVALRRLKKCRTAMLSGWALQPGAKFRYQVDAVFPLSDHADHEELWQCVRSVNPQCIYTVHGYTVEFAAELRAEGYEAWSLIRDNQLELGLASREGTIPVPTVILAEEEVPYTSLAPDSFTAWAMTCERIASESSRLKKQSLLAEYFQTLSCEKDLTLAVRWLTASLDDPTLNITPLQVGWATIRRALMAVSGMREHEFKELSRSQNDSGRTAFLVLQRVEGRDSPQETSGTPISLQGIAEMLEGLRQAVGPIEKSLALREQLMRLTALEGSYLTRLLTGELRTGSREGLVEEALALAYAATPEAVREAAMISGDLGKAAVLASKSQLHEATPSPFTPIKVMLASPEETAEDIWLRHTETAAGVTPSPETVAGASVWLEEKFDGIRAQIHLADGHMEIYTRDQRCVTLQFPELIQTGNRLKGSAIFDGEIIAYAEHKRLTFQDLQRRLGRKEQADLFIPSDISIVYVVFDLLWHDSESFLNKPLRERRRCLERLTLPPHWRLIAVTEATSVTDVEAAFHAARRHGNEGLIAKRADSPYTPGRRGKSWLKLKKALATLDVVVVKAEQGHGKRSHVLSDYTFAVRDEVTDELRVIGKAYTGLTDEEIEMLTTHFRENTLTQKGQVHTVTPNVVLEIAFDAVQPSRRHDSGLALRFPRIKSIRRDKLISDIDTLDYACKLAGVSR